MEFVVIGAPIGEIRRVRADIEHRVRTLLSDLGVPTTDTQRADDAPKVRDIPVGKR